METLRNGDIIKNPENPSQTYKVGQRGRRPSWVVSILEEHNIVTKSNTKVKKNIKRKYREWTWVNDGSMKNKVKIVAKNIYEALRIGNDTFSYYMPPSELQSEYWKIKYHNGKLGPGIYRYDNITEEWLPYKNIV